MLWISSALCLEVARSVPGAFKYLGLRVIPFSLEILLLPLIVPPPDLIDMRSEQLFIECKDCFLIGLNCWAEAWHISFWSRPYGCDWCQPDALGSI